MDTSAPKRSSIQPSIVGKATQVAPGAGGPVTGRAGILVVADGGAVVVEVLGHCVGLTGSWLTCGVGAAAVKPQINITVPRF